MRTPLPYVLLVGAGLALGVACGTPPSPPAIRFVSMTFNTGTSGAPEDGPANGGYGKEQYELEDTYYGSGVAWTPVVEDTRRMVATIQPDVITFQELFYSPECEAIPAEARKGFVCETWQSGDPTVVQTILGSGYQVACNLQKPDKCAAVKKSFGRFRGCSTDFCLDGLDGARVKDCGQGSRVGRGVIELVQGGTLTLVNVHGSSGIAESDESCRTKQFEQIFVDLGDGQPAASGERNLVMGDFNTDPGRLAGDTGSARRLLDLVAARPGFHFVTAVGLDVPATYAGLFNIDHVLSDTFEGECHPVEGFTPIAFFDHKPIVCSLSQ